MGFSFSLTDLCFQKSGVFFATQNSQHTLAQVYGMSSFSSPIFFSTFTSGRFSDFPPELCGEDSSHGDCSDLHMGGSHVEFDMDVDELLMLEALQEEDSEDDEVYILSSDSENELDNDTSNMIIPCIEREANTVNITKKKDRTSKCCKNSVGYQMF